MASVVLRATIVLPSSRSRESTCRMAGRCWFPKDQLEVCQERERVSPPLMKALRSRPGGGITLSRGTAAQRPKEPRLDATARPIAMLGFGVDGQRYALVCGSG